MKKMKDVIFENEKVYKWVKKHFKKLIEIKGLDYVKYMSNEEIRQAKEIIGKNLEYLESEKNTGIEEYLYG